jgi:hypothetical protein
MLQECSEGLYSVSGMQQKTQNWNLLLLFRRERRTTLRRISPGRVPHFSRPLREMGIFSPGFAARLIWQPLLREPRPKPPPRAAF